MKILSILSLSIVLFSCTSYFTRKDCENKNWFDYGYQVAMSGKRLNSDDYLSACRKVDADIQEAQLDLGFKSGMSNYCKPEIVFASGKKGQFFNTEFCDPGQIKILTVKHQEGVHVFCEPSSGFTFGSSGGVYNQICPKAGEDAFLKEYRRGRKRFLSASTSENQKRIQKIDSDVQQSTIHKTSFENDLKIIETVQLVRSNPVAPNNLETDPTETKKRDLRLKINQYENEIRSLNMNKSKLQEQIYSMEKEVITLD